MRIIQIKTKTDKVYYYNSDSVIKLEESAYHKGYIITLSDLSAKDGFAQYILSEETAKQLILMFIQ